MSKQSIGSYYATTPLRIHSMNNFYWMQSN